MLTYLTATLTTLWADPFHRDAILTGLIIVGVVAFTYTLMYGSAVALS